MIWQPHDILPQRTGDGRIPLAWSYVKTQGLILSFLLLLSCLAGADSRAQSRDRGGRPLSLDDLFNVQELGNYFGGPIDFSPDGRSLAFVIQRARRTARHFNSWLGGNDRADIYIISPEDRRPVNITNGEADGAGFWAPSWSPDGKRLAMLSTRGGNVCVWVWDTSSRLLRKVADRSVDIYSVDERHYAWISETRLVAQVLPHGAKPRFLLGNMQAAERANPEWQKTWRGEGVAVSVLKSGIKPDLSARPQGELLVINVESNKVQSVARGTSRDFLVSPDQQAVAYLRRVQPYQPETGKPWEFDYRLNEGKLQLEVVTTDGTQLLRADPLTYDVIPRSPQWSPDGKELAFLTYTKDKKDSPQLVRFLKLNGALKVVQTAGIVPSRIYSTNRGWMVFASRRQSPSSGLSARRDWWLVDENDTLRCVTTGMQSVPSFLYWDGGDSYVGLADGELWRIHAKDPPQNLTASFKEPIAGVVWAETRTPGVSKVVPSAGRNLFVVRVQLGDERIFFSVDLTSGETKQMTLPAPNASIIGFSPFSSATLFHESDQAGMRLWLARDPAGQASLIYETNLFLREIAPATARRIEYRSMDGETLGGWLLLPPHYQQGASYPLIVWVYPGSVAASEPGTLADITLANPLNLQIPASRGYVILRPSMPLKPMGATDDPMLRLTSGVLPAVEKVIELGIADPSRVFLMGHSFGAYATYGLVTQTRRFRAAVALSWASDLISYYNQLPPVERYDDYPHEATDSTAASIEYALRLGGRPPWDDFGRYLRNSPIFYVDRVETPLLIIHGDMDGGFNQAENFFMALYRQGKRAEFARYWGEGHVFQSPPNIRDMWERIFAWFDEHSKGPEERRDATDGKQPN